MTIPDRRSVLFIRMGELLQGHAPYLDASSTRRALAIGWQEIAQEVLPEMQRIRDEQGDTLVEFAVRDGEAG